MVSTIPDLQVFTLDTSVFPVTITQTTSGVTTAVNITGHTLSWIISAQRDSVSLLTIDVTSHTSPTTGVSSLTLTPANITTIGGEGDYWLTCVDVDSSGFELTRIVMTLNVTARPAR